VAEDISSRSLRLRASASRFAPGATVAAIVQLTRGEAVGGPRVAVRGRVLRVDAQPDGSASVAVALTRSRWLFAGAPRGTGASSVGTPGG
jgi:hypothetical protein